MRSIVEDYITALRDIRLSGAGVQETSYYGPLANLLNEVGASLKPKVRCIINLANKGAGIPDGGLFTPDQFQKASEAAPLPGQVPARGAIEVKSTADDVRSTVQSDQVRRYLQRYRQVLVTNYRDFVLVTQGTDGEPQMLEAYALADSEADFWRAAAHPRALATFHGERFAEYLKRVTLHAAQLSSPQDVAWFLASYARDARSRLEARDVEALAPLRTALEGALGLRFEGEKGEHFFRSTLVQTLFYGIFSAWVLWRKELPAGSTARFDWHTAAWSLHVPIIRTLFEQIATRGTLQPLDLVEVLDWAGAALNRIDPNAFFAAFDEGQAVQYFYEPFLRAFDPELRKELGVWYTPPEIVKYMVARVDTVLREELGLADGLADSQVYILDPCCGTGAYLMEVLQRIAATLRAKGEGAMVGYHTKQAAKERVFGFEILPAPFVVAHLQLGLLLQNLGAPLQHDTDERAGVYLTNALTGWEPPEGPKQHLMFPEMEAERDAADQVKQAKPILVILGNPPYNGFAGVAVDEERDLSQAYRTTKRASAPQGQGLNDLYVRFFRMAERRIVEKTGKGIVCFISNYSWLDGLSFTGMRERYLEAFSNIWIDSLNGDKFRTGKRTPDGKPDPSAFSTEANREGIGIGTAIALLVNGGRGEGSVHHREFWGVDKRQELLGSLTPEAPRPYAALEPPLALGLPFAPISASADYLSWPLLPEILPTSSPAVKSSRDLDIVDIDVERLRDRIAQYFDPAQDTRALSQIVPSMVTSTTRFDAAQTRRQLLAMGMDSGFFVRYTYRPFDVRWVYWHPDTKLLDEKREGLFALVRAHTRFLTSRQKAERQGEGTPFYVTGNLSDYHLTRPGATCFPIAAFAHGDTATGLFAGNMDAPPQPVSNLSARAQGYLALSGVTGDDMGDLLWMHALAIGYSPAYLSENIDGIRQDWPRIPLPATRDILCASAELGRGIAALLDTETPVPGVTCGTIRPELAAIGVISRAGGGHLNPDAGDLRVTAGWGHAGQGGVTMPARGKVVERPYHPEDCAAIPEGVRAQLGEKTCDLYLNDVAYWRNVPARVYAYTIGGYQVMKKWLSYREEPLLGRPLRAAEAAEVRDMARRIAAILQLEPELDANYEATKAQTFDWSSMHRP